MKRLQSTHLLTALGIVLITQCLAFPQAPSELASWVPPEPRPKAKTIFAAKPLEGSNIFKGEAEMWLADAIVGLELGTLSPIKDKEVSNYITRLGQHLVAHSTNPKKVFEFVVLDNRVENAMNIGAGRVYINLGMLKAVESEDELVGVIAHEIGHDVFRHAPKTLTRQLFWMKGIRKVNSKAEVESALEELFAAYEKNIAALVGERFVGWSRFNELEADKAAFYNVYKAGYNPAALNDTFRRYVQYVKEETGDDYSTYQLLTFLFGSHPPSSQRVTAVKWESNFIKMPKKEVRYKNAAFDAMKSRVSKM